MTLKGLLSGFLAKNSSKFTKQKELNTNYIGSIPSRVEYKDIKSALQAEDLGALIRIFEHFKRFDTQISSEFNRRKMQVTRLPLVIDCEDEAQKDFLTKFTQSAYFRVFLNELSSGIAYGFACFFENSTSFEGAEKALIKAFKGENYPIAEKLLFELGANAELLGYFLQSEKE